jgi:hypothetical protein
VFNRVRKHLNTSVLSVSVGAAHTTLWRALGVVAGETKPLVWWMRSGAI